MAVVKIREPHGSLGAAFAAGVLGAVVLTVLISLMRAAGWTPMNLEMVLGSMITGRMGDAGTWLLGFVWHLVNGGIFGLIYGAAFRSIGRSSTGLGAAFGVVHWIAAGIFMGILPAIHPLIPEQAPAPGFFGVAVNFITTLAVLVEHLIFGAIVGAIYHNSVRARTAYIPPREEEELRRVA